MLNLADLLKKFEFAKNHRQVIESEATEWCQKHILVKLSDFKIKLRKQNLIISSQNSIVKNAVFLHQVKLLNFLREKFGKKSPSKILFG